MGKSELKHIKKKITKVYQYFSWYVSGFYIEEGIKKVKKNDKLLHYNIPNYSYDLIEYLIKSYKYEYAITLLDYQTKFDKQYLHFLLKNRNTRNLQSYKKLIHKIIQLDDIDKMDGKFRSAIFYVNDNIDFDLLMEHNPNLNIKDVDGNNFIQIIITRNKRLIIDKLNGFNYNSVNDDGENATTTAMEYNSLYWIFRLIDNKNFNTRMYPVQNNWFHYLIMSNITKLRKKKIILKLYKDNKLQDNLLILIFKYIHNQGYEYKKVNKHLSFYLAILITEAKADHDDTKIIKLLTTTDGNGDTIVHYLAKVKSKKILTYIMQSFMFVYGKNKQGKTPYHLYSENKIINLLRKHSDLDDNINLIY